MSVTNVGCRVWPSIVEKISFVCLNSLSNEKKLRQAKQIVNATTGYQIIAVKKQKKEKKFHLTCEITLYCSVRCVLTIFISTIHMF